MAGSELAQADDLRALVRQAQRGDADAEAEARSLLQQDQALQAIYDGWASVAGQAKSAAIALMADDRLMRDSLLRQVAVVQAEVAGATPSPLEALLAERIAICWLQVHYADAWYTRQAKDGVPLSQGDYLQRHHDRAHRRYLAAIKALAQVRRLLSPAVQVNVSNRAAGLNDACAPGQGYTRAKPSSCVSDLTMTASPDDSPLDVLFQWLIARLRAEVTKDRPEYVAEVARLLASDTDDEDFRTQLGTLQEQIGGDPIDPWAGLLTEVHDLYLALDMLGVSVDGLQRADGRSRLYHVHTHAIVAHSIGERLTVLAKHLQRAGLVPSPIGDRQAERARKEIMDHPAVEGLRHYMAHGPRPNADIWARKPESMGLWEAMSIQGAPPLHEMANKLYGAVPDQNEARQRVSRHVRRVAYAIVEDLYHHVVREADAKSGQATKEAL